MFVARAQWLIRQTSTVFAAVKDSIVSCQIDRLAYYNVLPRDASRVPTNTGGTIPSGTPCKFL